MFLKTGERSVTDLFVKIVHGQKLHKYPCGFGHIYWRNP